MLSGIALIAMTTASFANDVEETKKADVQLDELADNCVGSFTVRDGKGNVVFEKTVTSNEASGLDCIKVMGAAHEIYEAYWGADYKVSSIVNYNAK